MTKDLTTGSPMRLIFSFTMPILFGMLFQQFYNLVDTMIVGKLLGAKALAAVGATGSINFFVIGFCTGLCSGFAIPVAQRMGARELSEMRRFVANAAYLAAAFALVLTAATGLLCRTILTVMRTPADIFENSNAYIFIIFMGIPATILYNLLAGIIRSLGDSKTPVYFLALSSFLNIFLDFALILWFGAGVAGAAIATVVSQGVSGVACLIYMTQKYPILRMTREERRLNGRYCGILCTMGVPMGLQYSITAIGSIVLQSAVNTLGSTYVAAVAAGTKLFHLLACPYDAIEIVNGVALVHADKCVGCKKCVAACPRHIIELIPRNADVRVACSSHEKGAALRQICNIGCIGCIGRSDRIVIGVEAV